ncbi:MAG: outer membrane beta-barrel protein [Rhizobiaceae bacterium]|nr:outer membrane beta-barrel protein [Rhizobiaceae bacterium]
MQTGKNRRPGSGKPEALLLTVAALGLAFSGVAIAQQPNGLRGILYEESTDPAPLVGDNPASSVNSQAGTAGSDDFVDSPAPDPAAQEMPAETVATSGQTDDTTASRRRQAPAQTDDLATGTVRQPPSGSPDNLPADPDAERVQPIEGLNRPPEQNPFEAPGIRWGSFILKPTLETGITATTNADSSVGGSSAILSETRLRLNAASDWSSHRASVDAVGTFRKTLSGEEVNPFEGAIDAELEIELGTEYRALGTFLYSATPESAASPVVIPDTIEEPMTQRIGGTLGLERDAGKARFAVTGGIRHEAYGDADLQSGGVLSQKDRDATLYSLTLRAGYEVSPVLTPFVAAEIGRNQYDQEVDSAGYRRSADIYGFRGGLEFDAGEKLTGEIAAGWITEHFDDDRLAALSTPTVEALALWSPQRGTNVRFSGSTVLEGSTTPGESGSVLYSTSMAIERQMRANLTGNAVLGFGYRNYAESDGYDVILNAEASLTWWLNRYAGLTGRLEYEDVSSNMPDRDTDTTSVFLGLKLQR